MSNHDYIPKMLHMQWHITEQCNLRCTHCYQESYKNKDLPFDNLITIAEQYKEALRYYTKRSGRQIRGHITVTGGEPLIRKDFFELLNFFSLNNNNFSYSILTNGTLIDKDIASKLKDYSPSYVQVSVEGKKETHNSIRGENSYERTTNAITHLVDNGINTIVSFTAHKKNREEFQDVVAMASQLRANRVWSDRLIPFGSGKNMEDLLFDTADTKNFFETMRNQKKTLENLTNNQTEVAMHRALQFLCGGTDYTCQAGKTLITVDVNGDVYPCRRMPINLGNLNQDDLLGIYRTNKLLKDLRDEEKIAKECQPCEYKKRCGGGLRCLSYATTGNPFEKDPGCWITN